LVVALSRPVGAFFLLLPLTKGVALGYPVSALWAWVLGNGAEVLHLSSSRPSVMTT